MSFNFILNWNLVLCLSTKETTKWDPFLAKFKWEHSPNDSYVIDFGKYMCTLHFGKTKYKHFVSYKTQTLEEVIDLL